jgi:hypothetical protein
MRICSGPGCGRAVPDNVRFCDECKSERPAAKAGPLTSMERATTDPIQAEYVTAQWKKLRAVALSKHPYCAGWRKQCNNLSVVVDHNVPAKIMIKVCRALGLFPFQKYPGFYVLSNLIGLCHSCHNSKTRVEDAQDWTEQLVTILLTYVKGADEGERRAKVIRAYSS